MVAYLGLSILLFTCGGFGALHIVERIVKTNIENKLAEGTRALIDLVKTTAQGSIKNYLRAVAEHNLEMANEIYSQALAGKITEKEARRRIRDLLLSQTIGETGYIYCIDGRGVAVVHPNPGVQGNSWTQFAFVRQQLQIKDGYIEYQWKNPGEAAPRAKALYMKYFAPFDWIISVSTYRDEFMKLLPMEEIRRSVMAVHYGRRGYAFVADDQGRTVIHPEIEDFDIDEFFAAGKRQDMTPLMRGEFLQVRYRWQNPGEREAHEKLAVVGAIPEFRWLVGSTGYVDEIYAPIDRARNRVILFVVGAIVLSAVLTLFVSESITRRLGNLMALINKGHQGDLTVRAAQGANDEIGRLGLIFNAFLERLQSYHGQLQEEIAGHRATAGRLQKERDFNALILSTVDALVMVLDRDGRIISFNRACEACSGYPADGAIGRRFWSLLIPEDEKERVRAIFERPPQASGGSDYLCHWVARGGQRRLVQWSNAAMPGPAGDAEYIVCAGRDITDHRATESALRQSEALFEAVFNQTYQLIGILAPDGTIRAANQAALDFAGVDAADLQGKKFWDAPFWWHSETVRERIQSTVESAARGRFHRMETTHTRADGEIRHVDFSLKPVFDGSGRVSMLIPEGRDISERKHAEEVLRLSEEKYRVLVENAHDAIFIVRKGLLQYANRSTEVLTGYTAEELRQRPLNEFIHWEQNATLPLDGGPPNDGIPPGFHNVRMVGRASTVKWVELNAIRIDWEGRPATMGFARDITSQKQMEAQLLHSQKMDAIGTLAGGIAHDFNNTLQAISGYTQLLMMDEGGLDEANRERLATIQHACDHARELTRQLLTFGRKIDSRPIPLDLNDELHAVLKLLVTTLPRMIEIETRLADDLRIVEADRTQIEQIVMNLGINAGHAMPDGGRLIIETGNVDLDADFCRHHLGAVPGAYAMLRVSDTGHGMDADTRAHIFEPFFTTRKTGSGTGLGLATVYGIVKSHKGYIACESQPGRGTTFKIYLPAAHSATVARGSLPEPVTEYRGSECIMLVDDDRTLRQLGREFLERFGYRVVEMHDGESAVEAYRRMAAEIDLIVLDLNMPGMGGMRCLEEIRRIDAATPVLIASGYASSHAAAAALDTHQGFVNKPYELKAMLKIIRRTLDRSG